MLVQPGEHTMIELTKLLFTWNGMKKQVVELRKHCHKWQNHHKRESLFDGRDLILIFRDRN